MLLKRYPRNLLNSTFALAALAAVATSPASAAPPQLPVFPGAVGFGSTTPAGSGRHLASPATTVIKVTNLLDSGAGSLRDCVKVTAPRVCVFETSGRIRLSSEIVIASPYITIAGQTAPAPGIMLTGAGLRIATHDVLVQHLQIRVGDDKNGPEPETRDGLTVAGKSGSVAKNVVLDHMSVSWAIDENFSVWYGSSSDVTLSNSIISESLLQSLHPEGPHGMGVLIGDDVKRVTLHGNLLADNNDRNPRLKPGAVVEFVNNVVYGWGGNSSWNQMNLSDVEKTKVPSTLAFIGNYYQKAPWSPTGATIYAEPPASATRVYVLDNFGPNITKDTDSDWKLSSFKEKPYRSLKPPFALNPIPPMTPEQTLESVLKTAGSRPKESNSVDARVTSEVTLNRGSLKDCITGCARPAGPYPEMGVKVRALSIPSSPNGDSDGDGYTNLEEWLQASADKVE